MFRSESPPYNGIIVIVVTLNWAGEASKNNPVRPRLSLPLLREDDDMKNKNKSNSDSNCWIKWTGNIKIIINISYVCRRRLNFVLDKSIVRCHQNREQGCLNNKMMWERECTESFQHPRFYVASIISDEGTLLRGTFWPILSCHTNPIFIGEGWP